MPTGNNGGVIVSEKILFVIKRNTMAEKILLVDDDSNILDGYRRSLSREFLIETAMGGEQALIVDLTQSWFPTCECRAWMASSF